MFQVSLARHFPRMYNVRTCVVSVPLNRLNNIQQLLGLKTTLVELYLRFKYAHDNGPRLASPSLYRYTVTSILFARYLATYANNQQPWSRCRGVKWKSASSSTPVSLRP